MLEVKYVSPYQGRHNRFDGGSESLHRNNGSHKSYILSLELSPGVQVVKDKGRKAEMRRAKRAKRRANLMSDGCQTAPKLGLGSTPDLRKWPREPSSKNLEAKRLRASTREEEGAEVLI